MDTKDNALAIAKHEELHRLMSPMGQGKATALNDMVTEKFGQDRVVNISVEPFEPCDEVSIASSAVTVDLSIGFWTGNKHDKKASKEVTDANGAKKGMARVNKSLMGDNANLEAIRKFVANARNSNYAMTMPWGDVGQRLLPTTGIFDHRRVMGEDGELAQEFWGMTNEFLRVYDWKVTEAQATLGNLFVRDDYPSVDALRRKFHWSCRYVGLPTSGDWRIDVETEGREQLIKESQEYFKRNIEGAMSAVWKRVYGYLSNMSERLDYATKEEKKGFHDTLVTNVLDMVELLKTCNITGDVQMEAARAKLEDALFGVTAASLKEDDYLRAETKRTVDEVIASLPSIDF